jgi:hypothetical protein
MRTDPTDTGGLFVRRRPGTAPVHYRALPERGSEQRRRLDGGLAFGLLALMTFINLLFWGPIPAAWLWVGGRVDYWTSSIGASLLVSFSGILVTLFGALMVEKRIDQAWILVRRAAGHDQRSGVMPRIFAFTAVVGGLLFALWFVVINGPGQNL